ncbi:hypothetical protein [Vibrio campbellii]|uniref:hypothetical protein n=1 Tax=Vibrio campbellii TaxID=680 RepID=UPI000AAD1DE0|nr:hypothetical protein [Vibrio campbellii]
MKELDDYVEQINLDLTNEMLEELGWVSDNVHQILYWVIATILFVVLIWGIFS